MSKASASITITKIADGANGNDGDSLSLSIISSFNAFDLTWYNTIKTPGQIITIEASTAKLSSADLIWESTSGTLVAVSDFPFRRTISVDTLTSDILSSADSIKVQVSDTTEQGTALSASLFIPINREAYPVPMYCGTMTSSMVGATNQARQEGAWAPGDFVLYLGDNQTVTQGDGTLSLNRGSIYAYTSGVWTEDNSASHIFSAADDILDAARALGSEAFPAFNVFGTILGDAILAKYLHVTSANIDGKLKVSQIDTKDDNGVGIELDTDGIRAYNKDANGNILSSWQFNSDGTGSIYNLNILGKLIASAISHEALRTQDATAFGSSQQTVYQKTFAKDLWSRSKLHSAIMAAIGNNAAEARMMTAVSGASYGGNALAKIGFARADLLDNVLSDTEAETVGSLKFGIYQRSYGVSAGSRHEKLAMHTNNFGFPVFIDAYWSLSGNWNWQEMYVYGTDGNERYSNNSEDNGTYHNCFILPPGHTIRIAAGSTAWFGNRTATFTVKVSPCPMVPYISQHQLNDFTLAIDGSIADRQYQQIGSVAAPASARYIAFFYCVKQNYPVQAFRISNGGTSAVLSINSASRFYDEGPVYMEIPESLRGKTLTIEAGAYRGSTTDGEGNTSSYGYTAYARIITCAFFSYIPNYRDAIFLEYPDSSTERIDCSYPTADYRDWDINRLIYSTFDTAGRLEKISGTTVCQWLDDQGFTSGAQFSADNSEQSYLNIDDTAYGSAAGNRLISIARMTYGYQLDANDGPVFIYQLDGTVSAQYGFYDTLAFTFYPLASESKIITHHIEPEQNISFDIGTLEKMFRHIYTQGMTLGEEGEDWLIEDNEGYIRLPGGLLVQWGVISQDSSSGAGYWVDVPFGIDFDESCFGVLISTTINSRGSNTYYVGYLDYPATVSGFSTRIRHVDSAFWLAIGY